MRYHIDVGFPSTLNFPNETFNLGYTTHAKIRRKRKGQYPVRILPNKLKISKKTIVEIHTEDNEIIDKAVVKVPYTKTKNIIMVLKLSHKKKNATVITFWVNNKKDKHHSLKKELYNIPKELLLIEELKSSEIF